MLCPALFNDLLNIELGGLRREVEGRSGFLPILIDVLLQFDPVTHRDIFPLVNLLLATGVELLQGHDTALS